MTKNRLRRRFGLQSAMEYLMTYGWAILIIAVVLGALFRLGVFSSTFFAPRVPPGACKVFRPSGLGTTQNINLMGVCTGQLPQYATQFNGQSSSIDVGNGASLAITNSITVSAWIKASNDGGQHTVASRNYGWMINAPYNNVIEFYGHDGTNPSGCSISWSQSYENVWIHLILITQKYTGSWTTTGYVNGVQVCQTTATTFNGPGQLGDSTIGVLNGGYRYFNGKISNVQIYNTSLSANDVQTLYISGIGGAPPFLRNLVGWWPLNGDTNDYSGNNNNGAPTSITFTNQWLSGYTPP